MLQNPPRICKYKQLEINITYSSRYLIVFSVLCNSFSDITESSSCVYSCIRDKWMLQKGRIKVSEIEPAP